MQILFSFFTLVAVLATGCSQDNTPPTTTKTIPNIHTKDVTKNAFKHAIKLGHDDEDKHIRGRSFFNIPWAEAPSATSARDGLGPLYSANTCIHCHPNNGAGIATKNTHISRSLVMRLSLKHDENTSKELLEKKGFIPEPIYGGQLSLHSTSNTPYEGRIHVSYEKINGRYDDNTSYELLSPSYTIDNLQYGPFHKNVNIAPHIGLALVGLGAIESIEEKDILSQEDIDDRDKDGISGKANWVYNPESKRQELGRFTWKAAASTVKQQAANAAHNDMSLSNPIYPGDNCTDVQKECKNAPQGRHEFDLPMDRLDAITFYLKTLRIPRQRKSENFDKGKKLFNEIGCVKCHTSSYKLSDGNTIHPFSDFLLHDMGEELSDGHTMFDAEANEFRTPPLWGIGLYKKVSKKTALLHDGRARSIEEAILWHNGEAKIQKEMFTKLTKEKREYLLEYLKNI